MKEGFIYILSNQPNGTLYIGVTGNPQKRIWEHKNKVASGVVGKYDLDRLVYFEIFGYITDAIAREKQLKNWRREWKLKLINEFNPDWKDLSQKLEF